MEIIDRSSCPNCGAGLPLGRAGGSIRCDHCEISFTYTATPRTRGRPAAVDQLTGLTAVPLHGERRVLLAGWQVERRQQEMVSELEACAPDSGASIWRVRAEPTERPLSSAFERIYYGTGRGELCAVDSATGNVAFVAALPAPVSTIVGEGRLAVADPSGPGQPRAAVLVHCVSGELVELDRMSGAQLQRWPVVDPPALWAVADGHLLLGPVRPDASAVEAHVWVLARGARQPVLSHPLRPGEAFSGALGRLAVIQRGDGSHAAYEPTGGQQAWRAEAPWDPRTGGGAVFNKELFVADGQRLTALPQGRSVTLQHAVKQLRVVAGAVIALTAQGISGHTRALQPRWTASTAGADWSRLADNGRVLICATQRAGQLWLRGILPPSGRTRWNVVVPEAGPFEGLQLADDVVLLLAGGRRFVIRADSGAILWTTGA